MKFSGKMWLMIILKFTKKQGFNISLENTFLEKPQAPLVGGGLWLTAFLGWIDFEKWNAAFNLSLFSNPSIPQLPVSIVKTKVLLKRNITKTSCLTFQLSQVTNFLQKYFEKFTNFFLFNSFAYLLHYYIIPSGVLRTQSNNSDGVCLRK